MTLKETRRTYSSSQSVAIRLDNIGRDFGPLSVIRNANFVVRTGEIVRLLGQNGSGKTVLLNLLSGYLLPTRGQIYLAEHVVTALPPWRRAHVGIRRSFQVPHIVADLTVIENMLLARDSVEVWPLIFNRGTGSARRAQAHSHLKEWASEIDPHQMGGVLSFGQCRMVELLRCFLDPGVLFLLDEPLAGLGPTFRRRIIQLIVNAARAGAAVIYANHEDEDLEFATTHTICLANGLAGDVVT